MSSNTELGVIFLIDHRVSGTMRRVLAHQIPGSGRQPVSRLHPGTKGAADSHVQRTVARPTPNHPDGVRPGDLHTDHGV